MARGKGGDLRRGAKGGRYTPPTRSKAPEQPVRVPVAVNTARTAAKQPLPASPPSQGIPPIDQLPPEDQTILRALAGKIARGESTGPEGQATKEEAFHEAVSELNDYILALRAELDPGFREPDHSDTDTGWAKAEPRRPSVKRVQHLAYNFFDMPGIRKTSIGIHGQKMAGALPHFGDVIAHSVPPCRTLSDHMSEVTALMANTFITSLETARLDQYRRIGMIMGYRTAGMRWPVDAALRHFAGQGVETFVEQLERVIHGAIEDGVDPTERVKAELLDRDGTIYRLMRVSFDRVNDAVQAIKGKSIEDARRILAENDYSIGGCPAVLLVESVVEPEAPTKRPLAYEYAMMIMRHIPPKLLQPA